MSKQILPSLARDYSRTLAQLSRPLISRPVSRAAPAIQALRMTSTINTIYTKNSYAPVGHYSQAFTANGQVWVAGQVALDIEGNKIKGSAKEQADQICKNMSEILKAAGSSVEKVIKINIFTSDMTKTPEFNSVFNDYFPQKPPRTSVEVSRLPLDVEFEVDIIAVI